MSALTRPAQRHQEARSIPFDVPQENATTSFKIWGAKDRAFRLDRVWYNNPTGLAADTTNYFDIKVTDGTSTLAIWSTLTTADGALAANTPVELNIQTAHDLAAGSTLTVTLTLHGTQTLPAGRIVVDGHSL